MANAEPTRAVTPTAKHYDTLFTGAVHQTHRSLETLEGYRHTLEEQQDLADGSTAADATTALKILRKDLDALEALRWPSKETK